MEFYSNNKDNNRSFPSPHTYEQPSFHNIGNNAGKKFIDGFINSGKITSPQGSKTFISNKQQDQRSGADFEFQAMWKKLQQNSNQPDEVSLRPTGKPETMKSPDCSVPPAIAEEQTNALKKILRLNINQSSSPDKQQRPMELRPQKPLFNQQPLNTKGNKNYAMNLNKFPIQLTPASFGHIPQAKPCGHVTCTTDFVQICASKQIPYPAFKYNTIQSSGEILCTVSFQGDYGNVVSDACRNNEEAAENAACKAIRLIMQHDENKQSSNSSSSKIMGYRLPRPGSRPFPSHLFSTNRDSVSQTFNQFPTPKWCQTSAGWSTGPTEVQQNKRTTPKESLLPLQQSLGKPFSEPPTNIEKQIEKNQRADDRLGVEQKVLSSLLEPQKAPKHYQLQPQKAPQQYQPQQQPTHQRHPPGTRRPGGRPRPRIAANFSVPFKTDKNT